MQKSHVHPEQTGYPAEQVSKKDGTRGHEHPAPEPGCGSDTARPVKQQHGEQCAEGQQHRLEGHPWIGGIDNGADGTQEQSFQDGIDGCGDGRRGGTEDGDQCQDESPDGTPDGVRTGIARVHACHHPPCIGGRSDGQQQHQPHFIDRSVDGHLTAHLAGAGSLLKYPSRHHGVGCSHRSHTF